MLRLAWTRSRERTQSETFFALAGTRRSAQNAVLHHHRSSSSSSSSISASSWLNAGEALSTTTTTTTGRRRLNYYSAVNEALRLALESDDRACIFGEDVAFGGVFRCTMGLAQDFGPERVFNTPLSEQGIAGFAIGLASMGHTAIAECQFADYIWPMFDQIVNEAAKYRYRSAGQYPLGGLTIRAPCSAVGHGALYHSQSVEGFFMGVHGIKVVMARSPSQAKGLLLAAIRDPDPVLFLEPKILYRAAVEDVPEGDYTLPLGRAEILTAHPQANVTIISWGASLYTIEQALLLIKDHPALCKGTDVRAEIIDLRTLLPWDRPTVFESVRKSGRAIIVHEASKGGGAGEGIAAEISEECFLHLEAPVQRVTGADIPFPLALEKFHIPQPITVVDAIKRTLTF